jgi:energy-converting hydrogenase Eha subunit A
MQERRSPGVIARAAAILVRPGRTWELVAGEPVEEGRLFGRYVAPLAAIPAVCGVAGPMVFAYDIAQVRLRDDLIGLLLKSVVAFGATLIVVWLLGWLIAALARPFGGAGSRAQAVKLAAYSGTAFWVAGVFHLYPSLALPMGALGAVYALYTLYLGLGPLMRVEDDRRLTCFAAILLCLLILGWLRDLAIGAAAELGGPLGVL